MNAEHFREVLSRRPFEPFSIRMSNGDVFPVRHPENAIVLKTRVVVADPENDRTMICSLLHIASIEFENAAPER
jgi:hypothetical protein